MKINFTKKEYRALLEMLYLSDWMMHARFAHDEANSESHEQLRKRLYSYSKEMGADDVIEYCNDLEDYYENSEYEKYIHERYISPYNEDTFWDELAQRLSLRDVFNKMSADEYDALETLERMELIEDQQEKYSNEFEQHGLKHVRIEVSTSVSERR